MSAINNKRKGDADDLEDNFVLEEEFIPSGGEDASDVEQELVVGSGATKRALDQAASIKKQKKRKKGPRTVEKDIPTSAIEQAIWVEDSRKESFPHLSAMELEEKNIPATAFVDTSEHAEVNRHTDLQSLPTLIKAYLSSWKQKLMSNVAKAEIKGAPVVLIVAPSGIRCADRVRELAEFQTKSRVAKLFSKHFKAEEQKDYLAKVVTRVAVGTPNRLHKLEDLGVLKGDRIDLLILDCQRDKKRFTILEMRETRLDVFAVLDGPLGDRVRSGECKVMLF